jgi:antitoxin HigA-1
VISRDFSAYVSTHNGASYSGGKHQMPMMSKSLITIKHASWQRFNFRLPDITISLNIGGFKMIPSNRKATHPGAILLKEFLEPMGITQKALANHINMPVQSINQIIKGKRGISPDTAWLFADAFSTSPEFWLNLQATHDLSLHKPTSHIQPLAEIGA